MTAPTCGANVLNYRSRDALSDPVLRLCRLHDGSESSAPGRQARSVPKRGVRFCPRPCDRLAKPVKAFATRLSHGDRESTEI
jgi:hypothetical protein